MTTKGTERRRVLIVDDEPRLVRFVRMNLELEGFMVSEASNGLEALEKVRQDLPDLVLLDVMLPEMDGFATLEQIRQTSTVPVIMLTAKGEEDDRIRGLDLGADDYITKPFSPREVIARVRAVLRRASGSVRTSGIVRVGDLAVDLVNRIVTVGGRPVALTPTEFDILAVLARNPGRPFTRVQLMDLVYDVAYAGYDRAIDSHIKNLRRKIEPDPGEPRYILTVYGVGYKLGE